LKDTDGIFKNKLQKARTGHVTKQIRETESTDQRHESGRRNTRLLKRTWQLWTKWC